MAAEFDGYTVAEVEAMAKHWHADCWNYRYPKKQASLARTVISNRLQEAVLLARENRVSLGEVIREIDGRLNVSR
jgi:hypothetical protein